MSQNSRGGRGSSSSTTTTTTTFQPPVLTPSDEEFWEFFYDENGEGRTTYEWYASYPSIRQLLLPFVLPNHKILHIGCGNSLLAEQLIEDPSCPEGVFIMSIDINQTAIDSMNEREASRVSSTTSLRSLTPIGKKGKRGRQKQQQQQTQTTKEEEEGPPRRIRQLQYEVRDVSQTGFKEGEFDLVVDKGMVDAFLSTGEEETGENEKLRSLISEVFRVLSPRGQYLILSRNASFLLFPYFYELGCHCNETHFQSSTSSSLFFYTISPPTTNVLQGGEEEEEEENQEELG